MIIKNPPVYDVSHWELIANFSSIAPRPALIITKATESLQGIDSKFIEYFAGMKAAGIPRGAYHFFRKAYDAVSQAKHFLETVKPHLNNTDILALDIEEGGETAAQIIAFCDFVQAQCPQNLLMIYSRKNILDTVPMTQAQKDRLKKLPVWTAGYPYDHDMFDSVPVMYVPDQSKWGAVWLWQYSDRGIVAGVQGEVDLNWIAPALLEKLPSNIPSEPELPTGAKMYDVISTIYNMTLRSDHNTGAVGSESVTKNTVMKADEIWTAPIDLYKTINGSQVKINSAGDKWAHIFGINGALKNAWTAVVHNGLKYCDVTAINEPSPTPIPNPQYQDVAVSVNVYDGAIVVLVNGEEWVRKA